MLGVTALVVSIAVIMGNSPPATPTITEPHQNGLVLNHEDVHMETAPFSDPDPGDTHAASDWEIWTVTPQQRVWAALGVTGPERVHIHLGDGVFQGSHSGRSSLLPSVSYRLRVRHKDSSGQAATQWSQYAERTFSTGPLSSVFPMELVDVAATPAPEWRDLAGVPVLLPGGGTPASLRLESGAAAALLVIAGGSGGQNVVANPPALPQHEAVRVRLTAGGAPLVLPETDLEFTDSTGVDRVVFLPSVGLAAGQSAYFWVSTNGSTFVGQGSQTQPDFSVLARGAALPWEVNQPGFRVELVATGFQLPVNVAVVPSPGPGPTAPLMYITELYGSIKVVRRDGTVGTYASGLLNFNPTGSFPGSGEQGITGILVEPASGDIFATLLYDASPPSGPHYPKVVRFHSSDGGQTAATQTTVLDMVGEPQGQSHQISNVSIGPDGRLYVHMGDGFDALTAQNLDSFRGKILRMSLAGAALSDNPFYNAANGINSRDYVYAYGFRNPFGGSWRAADGKLYEIENGPMVDRFARVNRGQNYLWDGSDASMRNFAIYNWEPPVAPVNIAFVQTQTFGGSQFPPGKMGHVFATLSGPTWSTGPQPGTKRIVEMVLDASGNLVSGPTPLITYNGSGKATCVGLAAGPDGLYFTDLYKDVGFSQPTDPGANVLRVRYVGAADFSADVTSGPAPLEVHFTDLSTVPSPSAWLWSFGDGSTGTQQNPTHTYAQDGVYTVRLSVTGPGGAVVKQRNAYIRVGQFSSVAFIGGSLPLSPADQAAASRLVGAGFLVEPFDDEPANRPSAQALAAAFDLVVISSTVSSSNIGGEFRTANLPMVFWERALLQVDREALSDLGATFGPATGIDILPVSHPITAGLNPGAMQVFSSGQTMSLAIGQIPPGAVVLARRSGSADAALVAADAGAALLGGYTAPARRVFFFLEDAGFLAATPAGAQLLDRAVCWAGGFAARITADPSPVTVAPGQVATFEVSAAGAAPLSYRWRRNGVDLTDNGRITGAATRTLRIDPVQAGDAGGYDAVVSNGCGQDTSAAAALTVASCYANCDGSTAPPILNVGDFICFQSKFAAGDPYANCDGSTVEPVLNVNDFVCFQGRYAAGCP